MFNCYPHLPTGGFQMVFLKWSKLLCVEGRNILLWSNALLVVRILTWNNGVTNGKSPLEIRKFPRPFPNVFFGEGKWAFFFAHLRFFTKHQRKLVNICIKLDSAFRLHRFWVPPTQIPSLIKSPFSIQTFSGHWPKHVGYFWRASFTRSHSKFSNDIAFLISCATLPFLRGFTPCLLRWRCWKKSSHHRSNFS